jgi:arylsulfatase A-like enzyme
VRTGRFKYVLYRTLEEELYDLARDPHELRNLAGSPAARPLQARMRWRLRTLCRPAPPGFAGALAAVTARR